MNEAFKIKLPDFFPTFAVVVSVFGLATVTFFLMKPVVYFGGNFAFSSTLTGSLYAAICGVGICAVFYPRQCQRTFSFRKESKPSKDQTLAPKTVKFSGHHPECAEFSPNRIKIGRTLQCAACSGLLAGAIVALVGAVLYFFIGYNFLWSDPRIIAVSNVGMVLGLFQFKFSGYGKLAVNAFFVVCSLITLVMADLLSKSLLINLYTLCLIVFLLTTRILLSNWYNKKTCIECGQCV